MKQLLFVLLCILTGSRSLIAQNRNEALKLDSASFEKLIDPKKYGVHKNPYLEELEKIAADQSISDSAFYELLSGWNKYPSPKKTGVIVQYYLELDTNYTVPYLVYIPKGYKSTIPTTLLVYFKGGWLNRKTLPRDYAKEIITDNPTFDYLDKHNVIEIFPALESKLAIYGNYGYTHLTRMIAETKKIFNIDDNNVFLSGFSDGGKTTYLAATLLSSAFACFYPINSSIVSSPDFPNYNSRPILSFIAEKDELTDPRSILSKADYAIRHGADWRVHVMPGRKHYYKPYQQDVLPAMFRDMSNRTRNPFPTHINYFRGFNYEPLTGMDWVQIKVNNNLPPSASHVTDSIFTFSGDGEKRTYLYGEKTGQLNATFFNNHFTLTTSLVDEVEIYISPEMIRPGSVVTTICNGVETTSTIAYDRKFMLADFMENFDRKRIWINKIVLKTGK